MTENERAIMILEGDVAKIENKLQYAELETFDKHYLKRESYKLAIEATREKQERDNPQPLTLDELKERVGQFVWITQGCNIRCCVLAKFVDSYNPEAKRFVFTDDQILFECSYGKTWVAFDHEPRECFKATGAQIYAPSNK